MQNKSNHKSIQDITEQIKKDVHKQLTEAYARYSAVCESDDENAEPNNSFDAQQDSVIETTPESSFTSYVLKTSTVVEKDIEKQNSLI